MNLFSITDTARQAVQAHLHPGARAIDATAGNGLDTVTLAEAVGPDGQVYAFDVQADAIAAAQGLLKTLELDARVQFIQACHSTLADHVSESVQVIMFNFGYLPHGDKAMTTQSATSLAALEAASDLLAAEGLLSLVTYPGHETGADEHRVVRAWCEARTSFRVAHVEILASQAAAPHLFLLRKTS